VYTCSYILAYCNVLEVRRKLKLETQSSLAVSFSNRSKASRELPHPTTKHSNSDCAQTFNDTSIETPVSGAAHWP